jgi:hypothetical protein
MAQLLWERHSIKASYGPVFNDYRVIEQALSGCEMGAERFQPVKKSAACRVPLSLLYKQTKINNRQWEKGNT